METEIWKDIYNYEDVYQVSDMGRVRNKKSGRILKPYFREKFGGHINLSGKTFSVHRLVAMAFLDKPEGFNDVDHIDGNVKNNKIQNLRWTNRHLNCLNTKLRYDNKYGMKGVFFDSSKNLYTANWQENKKLKRKSFKTQEEAIEHRLKMVELHYSQTHYIENR